MNRPNAQLALAEREKLCGYLLNAVHPDNRGKAAFFLGLGFDVENWTTRAAAFTQLAVANPVVKSVESRHGWKHILDGRIKAPNGTTPRDSKRSGIDNRPIHPWAL